MHWWMHNPVADMPGPVFLWVYGATIACIVIVAAWRSRWDGRTDGLGSPPIPQKPDPVEIAYLRGGENEVTRLVVFSLLNKHYLRLDRVGSRRIPTSETRIKQKPRPHKLSRLSDLEKVVFQSVHSDLAPQDLFKKGATASEVKAYCEPIEESLLKRGLLVPAERHRASGPRWFVGAALILAIGGYKMAIALEKGRHNVAFLVLFAVVGLVALGYACRSPRATRRGRDDLNRFKVAFEGLKPHILQHRGSGTTHPSLLLLPAIFGVAVLSGAAFAYTSVLFGSYLGSGGASGSCGTSGDGGGGGGDSGGGEGGSGGGGGD